ncbi:Ig-like domain-containing protein, partial [Salmonella enterica]|nr:Ig-like domain-containing protein [Salmonella enterica]EJP9626421.1 Ig-like domain-containing protein [Salmonella enterica]
RYNFVERNNRIALQYRKQELIRVHLPESVSGEGGETVTLDAQVKSKYGVQSIEWSAPEFIAHGGTIERQNLHSVYLRLPPYIAGEKSEYPLTALATDVHGNTNRASTLIRVEKPSLEFAAMDVVKDFAVAGQEKNEVRIRLADKERNNITDKKVVFSSVQGVTIEPESVQTDFNGTAVVRVGTKTAGPVPVRATLENGNTVQRNVTFVADSKQLHVTLTAKQKNGVVANGTEEHTVNVVSRDINGNAVQNVPFELSADNGAVLKDSKIKTDNKGVAEFRVTNTHAGKTTVKVKSESTENQIELLFNGDQATAVVKNFYADPEYNRANADGRSENRMIAEVRDSNDNPVANAVVDFFAKDPLVIGHINAFTDAEGKSTLKVRSTQGGTFAVRSCIASECKEANTFFNSLSSIIGKVSVTDGAIADGKSKNTLTVFVYDEREHPLENVDVYFSSRDKTIKIDGAVKKTNKDGKAQLGITSDSALSGVIDIGLKENDFNIQQNVNFQPNVNSPRIDNIWATKNEVVADGKEKTSVFVLIVDNNGNPIKGVVVSGEVTNGAQLDNAKHITNDSGIAEFSVFSTKLGSVSFGAEVNNQLKKRVDDIVLFNGSKSSAHLELKNISEEAKANGFDKYDVKISARDKNNIPVTGMNIIVQSPLLPKTVFTTNANGDVFLSVSSNKAGLFDMTATLNNREGTVATKMKFVPDISLYHFADFKSSGPSVADGSKQNQVSVVVLDYSGSPVSKYPVDFTALTTGMSVDNAKVYTNDNGIATVNVKSTTAGNNAIKLEIPNGLSFVGYTSFISDKSTKLFSFFVNTESVLADGKSKHIIELKSEDKNGNFIPNVDFSFDNKEELTITPRQGKTDEHGLARIEVTSTKSGVFNLRIDSLNIPLVFIADSSDYFIKDIKVDKKEDIIANAWDAGHVTFSVVDKYGNPLSNYPLDGNLSGLNGAYLESARVYTNTSGCASFSVKSTKAGTVNLLWGMSSKVSLGFVADAKTAVVSNVEILKNNAKYNDLDGNLIRVKVTDTFGNPVRDIPVQYTVSPNKLSLVNETKTDENGFSTVNVIVTNQEYFDGSGIVVATVNEKKTTAICEFSLAYRIELQAIDDPNKREIRVVGKFYDEETGAPSRPNTASINYISIVRLGEYMAIFSSPNLGEPNPQGEFGYSFKGNEYDRYFAIKEKDPQAKFAADVEFWVDGGGIRHISKDISEN